MHQRPGEYGDKHVKDGGDVWLPEPEKEFGVGGNCLQLSSFLWG